MFSGYLSHSNFPFRFRINSKFFLTFAIISLLLIGNLTGVSQTQSPGIQVKDMAVMTPDDLVLAILGPGVSYSNVKYSGSPLAAGTFSGGSGIIGFEGGIVLGTGTVKSVIGPNKSDTTTTNLRQLGDADLNTISLGTRDAAVLEFDFVPAYEQLTFQYVFTSEEYNEFANSPFNDVFAFFLNGANVALIPGTDIPVSINTVNGGKPYGTNAQNIQFYKNNDLDDPGPATINTEMDGLTVVLSVQAKVKVGQTNHIKLAIADVGDSSLDSNVFIRTGSFTSVDVANLKFTNSANVSNTSGGATITYNIKIANEGPSDATSLHIYDLIPEHTTFQSITAPNGWTCEAPVKNVATVAACHSSGMRNKDCATLILTVKVNDNIPLGTKLINKAYVSSGTPDPNLQNNTATVSVVVGQSITACGSGTFSTDPTQRMGDYISSLDAGDLNGDGKPDLVVANMVGGDLSILLGNGAGGFTAAPKVTGMNYPVSTAIGDLNGDGKPDLVVANAGSYQTTVMFGKGDGTFTFGFEFFKPEGAMPAAVVTADFDKDGRLDFAVAYNNTNRAIVYFNRPGSYLDDARILDAGDQPLDMVGGDFNGDGYTDLAVANYASNDVTYLTNTKVANFTKTSSAVGRLPRSLAVTDFNGDKLDDLVVANDGTNFVTTLTSNSSGAPTRKDLLANESPSAVTATDFNGDGKPDVIVADYWVNRITTYQGACASAFAPEAEATGLQTLRFVQSKFPGEPFSRNNRTRRGDIHRSR